MKHASNWTRWGVLALVLLLAFSSVAARFAATTLRGVVFNDANRNGKQDGGEAGLIDIRVQISTPDLSYVQEYRTGDDGSYGPTLSEGTFNVRVLPPEGWSVTTQASYTAFVQQGKAVTDLNFGLVQGAAPAKPATGAGAPASTSAPGTLPTSGGEQPVDPARDLGPLLAVWLIGFGAAFVALTALVPRSNRE